MKLLENIKEIVNFILYKEEEVLVYKDKIVVGSKALPANTEENYRCVQDVLYKQTDDENDVDVLSRYDGNAFVEEFFRYEFKKYINSRMNFSYEFEKGVVRVSSKTDGVESLFEFEAKKRYKVLPLYNNSEILILCIGGIAKELLFYTKTGERLWEYKVEEGREIHESGVMVVDDIVVIPLKENGHAVLVEGYNLLTGEKLWEVDDKDCCNYCYSIDQNKMLYSLASFYCKDHTVELRLTQINPFTGEAEMSVLKEGDYWGQIRSLNETIYGNKLFYVNLNKAEGFSLGVVDLDSKELIEDMPLESDGFHVEKPIVTDDKIYVLILHDDKGLNELRIYENEFK